jgi:hypothetical protein
MSYFITKHCKDRFLERIAPFSDVREILKIVYSGSDLTNTIFDKYPRYILYLYERYSECSIKIVQNGDVTFICKRRPDTQSTFDVMTCYRADSFDKFGKTALPRQEIYLRIKIIKSKLKSSYKN